MENSKQKLKKEMMFLLAKMWIGEADLGVIIPD